MLTCCQSGAWSPAPSAKTMLNRAGVMPLVAHCCRSATHHPTIFVSRPADHTAFRERCNDNYQPRYSCPRTYGGCLSRYKSHHRTTPGLALLRRTVAQDDSGWQRAHDHHTWTGESAAGLTSPSSFMSLPASQLPIW